LQQRTARRVRTLALDWAVATGSSELAAPARLDAIGWREGTRLARLQANLNASNATDTPLELGQVVLDLPEPRRALVGLQLPGAFSTANGTAGSVFLEVNGTRVQQSIVQTQNGNLNSPVAQFVVPRLPAGQNVIRADSISHAWGTPFVVAAGQANLWAVVLE
jgi:hypothetical protein